MDYNSELKFTNPSSSTSNAGSISGQQTVVLEEERYQTGPSAQHTFRPMKVKALVEELLKTELVNVSYDGNESTKLSTEIANKIRSALKELQLPRYKLMVQVVLGENKGAGVQIGSRCLWDPNTDHMAEANFTNDSLFCCAIVYGVYLY